MRSKIFKIVLVLNIIALGILFVVWWTNGKDDTWFYVIAALIVLTSFPYMMYGKKDGDR